jgi:hypothetical protein
VRRLCGSAPHEEELVHEYTYEIVSADPRERITGVREGYVRCKGR